MAEPRKGARVLRDVEVRDRPFAASLIVPHGRDREVDAAALRYDEGRAEGLREAREASRAELETLRAELADSLSRLASLEETLTRRHESLLLEIALEAAGRIVRARIDGGDPVASRALAEAMSALPASSQLRARVHPSDLEAIAASASAELARGKLELIGDSGIARGGCVVESAVGTVDATLEAATAAVAASARGEAW